MKMSPKNRTECMSTCETHPRTGESGMNTCETHPSTLTAEYRQGQARCGYCGHDQCRLWRLWSRAVPSVETRGDCGHELCRLWRLVETVVTNCAVCSPHTGSDYVAFTAPSPHICHFSAQRLNHEILRTVSIGSRCKSLVPTR